MGEEDAEAYKQQLAELRKKQMAELQKKQVLKQILDDTPASKCSFISGNKVGLEAKVPKRTHGEKNVRRGYPRFYTSTVRML